MIKKCIICKGTDFNRLRCDAITCSVECGKELKKKHHKKWTKIKSLKKIDQRKPKHCTICGKVFPNNGSTAITCSDKCRNENRNRWWREYYDKKIIMNRPEKTCVICNRILSRKNNGATVCSEECRIARIKAWNKANHEKRLAQNRERTRNKKKPKKCICGKMFKPTKQLMCACSVACSEKHKRLINFQCERRFRQKNADRIRKEKRSLYTYRKILTNLIGKDQLNDLLRHA